MELVTNTRRGRFITDEFHLMEDNMIVEEKAHGSKRYIYILTIFFLLPLRINISVALESAIEVLD